MYLVPLGYEMGEDFPGTSGVSGAFSVHSIEDVGHEDRRV